MSDENSKPTSEPVEKKSEGEHDDSHQNAPHTIPGVLQVPLLRHHGLGHGPVVLPGRAANQSSTGALHMPGRGPIVRRDLVDENGDKLEPIHSQVFQSQGKEDKD